MLLQPYCWLKPCATYRARFLDIVSGGMTNTELPTHSRGSKRINLIWVMSWLLQFHQPTVCHFTGCAINWVVYWVGLVLIKISPVSISYVFMIMTSSWMDNPSSQDVSQLGTPLPLWGCKCRLYACAWDGGFSPIKWSSQTFFLRIWALGWTMALSRVDHSFHSTR